MFSATMGAIQDMIPVTTLQGALQAARVPDGAGSRRELSAVAITQLAQMVRASPKKHSLPDADPLLQPRMQNVAQAPPQAVQGGAPAKQGRKVKANTILDQADDGEITLLTQQQVDDSFTQLKQVKGGEVTLDSEPSPDQVSGMTERVNTLDLELHAGFSLCTPYGRRPQE